MKLIKLLLSTFVKREKCFCLFTVFILVPVGGLPPDVSRIMEVVPRFRLRAQKILPSSECNPEVSLGKVKFSGDVEVFFIIDDDIRIIPLKHIDKSFRCKA